MKRRWIIRSFFIALLGLCVSAWIATFYRTLSAVYNDIPTVSIGSTRGNLWMFYFSMPSPSHSHGLFLSILPFGMDRTYYEDDLHHLIGFAWGSLNVMLPPDTPAKVLRIPFWFPTALSAGLLWFVWRKTRPKADGRAFPVELAAKKVTP